jgi:hypothetical protein
VQELFMRALVPLEVITAFVYAYLGLSLSWTNPVSIVRGLHFVIVVAGALAIAWGAWRSARWTPKLAIGLAALVGIPNFTTLAAVVQLVVRAAGPAVTVSFGLVILAAVSQLVALVIALRRLRFDGAAV